MEKSPVTRPSLLVRIRDAQDREAWAQFVEVYAPLVYGLGRKRGLQDADAADLTQEVLRAVARSAERLDYDPRRGSFRGWLYTVARNKLNNFLAGQRRQSRGSGDTDAQHLLEAQPAREMEESQWELEYQRRLFHWAAEQIRTGFEDSTWQAFWRTAVDGRPASEVADELGMNVGAVYMSKSRVLTRLRQELSGLMEY